jgi:hypothetical protein
VIHLESNELAFPSRDPFHSKSKEKKYFRFCSFSLLSLIHSFSVKREEKFAAIQTRKKGEQKIYFIAPAQKCFALLPSYGIRADL